MYLPGLTQFCQSLVFFLPFTTVQPVASSESSFSYENPRNWVKKYPQCGGKNQSPIAINTSAVVPIEIPAIHFGGYDTPLSQYLTLKNDGHTIKVNVPRTTKNSLPFITGGPLKGKYEAVELHFHWGSPRGKGSEHQINNQRFDLEMHIVHKNTNYSSIEEGLEHADGLAVVAVLFKLFQSMNRAQKGVQTIVDIVPLVNSLGKTAHTQQVITLGSLLSYINHDKYYTYQGSLTTPPCSEAVTWLVYPESIPIPFYDVNKFWSILDEHGNYLLNNFRPLQPINSRKVYARKM